MRHWIIDVPFTLPTRNDLDRMRGRQDRRTGHNTYSQFKKKVTSDLVTVIRSCHVGRCEGPVDLDITFREPNRKRDPDNVMSAGLKLILDALIEADIITNDNWRWLRMPEPFTFRFEHSPGRGGVVVSIVDYGSGAP